MKNFASTESRIGGDKKLIEMIEGRRKLGIEVAERKGGASRARPRQ